MAGLKFAKIKLCGVCDVWFARTERLAELYSSPPEYTMELIVLNQF